MREAERTKARELRARGTSVRAIARTLGVAQSSVSVWVRDVVPDGTIPRPKRVLALKACPALVVWRTGRSRRCSRCTRQLPLEMFGSTARGRQGWCRPCFRDHARQKGAAHYQQIRAAHVRRRETARRQALAYLATRPCVACGESDPVVLEFDHLDGKAADIARLVADGCRPERLLAEIAKCDVVCANCHRHRTARRAGWLRCSPTWRQDLAARTTMKARNQLYVYSELVQRGCIECGITDLVVLDFDHVGAKRGDVCRMAAQGYSIASLGREVAACEVRCASCHRRRTAERAGHYRALEDLGIGHTGAPSTIVVPPDRRQRARELRSAGEGITEIAAELGAAPGTVSSWVRDIALTDEQQVALHARRRERRLAQDAADAPTGRKTCTRCEVEQPLTQFARNGTRRRSLCRTCEAARTRGRTPEYRAAAAAAQRERRRAARGLRSRAGDPPAAAQLPSDRDRAPEHRRAHDETGSLAPDQ